MVKTIKRGLFNNSTVDYLIVI